MNQNNPKLKKKSLSIGSEVLQSLLENGKSPLSEQFMRWRLWAKWEEVVGSTIAKNAEPVGFQRGVLYVWVRNSTWMQQMIFMKDTIRETINKKFDNNFVKYIRFTLDRHEVPQDNSEDLKNKIGKFNPK